MAVTSRLHRQKDEERQRKTEESMAKGRSGSRATFCRADDDVYYYIRWRLKLEGETENMCVCTKERKGVAAAVLMATPCTNSLGGESGGQKHEGREGRSACSVSYTHLRAHETPEHLVCRLLLPSEGNNSLALLLPSERNNSLALSLAISVSLFPERERVLWFMIRPSSR